MIAVKALNVTLALSQIVLREKVTFFFNDLYSSGFVNVYDGQGKMYSYCYAEEAMPQRMSSGMTKIKISK